MSAKRGRSKCSDDFFDSEGDHMRKTPRKSFAEGEHTNEARKVSPSSPALLIQQQETDFVSDSARKVIQQMWSSEALQQAKNDEVFCQGEPLMSPVITKKNTPRSSRNITKTPTNNIESTGSKRTSKSSCSSKKISAKNRIVDEEGEYEKAMRIASAVLNSPLRSALSSRVQNLKEKNVASHKSSKLIPKDENTRQLDLSL